MKKLKGAIFDLDGTLLDSMHIWKDIGGKYLRKLGIAPKRDLQKKVKTRSLRQSAILLKKEYDLPFSVEEIIQQINTMIEAGYRYHVPAKPHVPEFLQTLANGKVKICIATATDRYLAEAAIERLGISHYFNFILTCGEVGCGKDQPLIFQKSLELLDTGIQDTVVFEDALHAILSAKSAGFKVIGVHDPSAAADEDAIKAAADEYIYSFAQWEVK